jgi:tetratricopeptide (TPR) repeat protein
MSEASGQDEELVRLEGIVAENRAKLADAPGGALPAYADALMGLAGKLAELSRHDEALAAAEEGVGQFRALYGADRENYTVALASGLNNLSNRLSDLGRDDEARAAGDEALELAASALETNPDQARFVLVSTLMNQSGRSWRAGQSLRAIEEMGTAVDVFREGGEALFSFLGVMVDALHRNAMALSEAGRWEEAVMVRRMTGQLFPKDRVPAPVNHLLALTLQQAAFAASRDGRPGEGLPLVEEAVELARALAEAAPGQYRLFLAQSLANLAGRQHEAHADPEALEAALEAVNTFQEVAKVDATSALMPLAGTLETFASILTSLGHDQQARNVLAQREQLMSVVKPVEE